MSQTILRGEDFFAQKEGRELLKLEARQLMNRIVNKVMFEWDADFNAGLAEDPPRVKELGTAKAELREMLRRHSTRELGNGNDNG